MSDTATKTSQSPHSSNGHGIALNALQEAAEISTRIRLWAKTTEGKKMLLGMDWDAFLAHLMLLIPAQYGNLAGDYLGKFYGWAKVSSQDQKGDFVDANGLYIEVKTSFSDKVNMKQIRLWQNVDYRIFHITASGQITRFDLTHAQMASEVKLCGNRSHTQNAGARQGNVAQGITLVVGSRHYLRWVEKYQNRTDSTPDCLPAAS
jgi:hypothetical protein